MRRSITSFIDSANARVLQGQVRSIDTENDRLEVLVNGALLQGVPYHYNCNHNETNHGARVFLANDLVDCLYTGNGSAVSAGNLVVMGLVGEVRRCRASGGIAITAKTGGDMHYGTWRGRSLLYMSGLTEKPATLSFGQVVPGTVPGGMNDWIGSDGTVVTWMWAGFRYGVASGSNQIWIDGATWDTTAPSGVRGAALLGSYVIIAGADGRMYRRIRNKSAPWEQLSGPVMDVRTAPVFFSGDGTKAIFCNQPDVVDITINILSYTAVTTHDHTVDNATENYVGRAAILADYRDNIRLVAYQHYTIVHVREFGTVSSTTICTYSTEESFTNVETVTTSAWIECGDLTIDILKWIQVHTQSVRRIPTAENMIWSRDSYNISTIFSLVSGIDLRYGMYAVCERELAVTSSIEIDRGYFCENGYAALNATETVTFAASGNLYSRKKINGTLLGEKTYGLEMWQNSLSVKPSSNSYDTFEPLTFNASSTTQWDPWFLNTFWNNFELANPIIADSMGGLSLRKNTTTGDVLSAWFYEQNEEPYIDYNGANIRTALGLGPCSAEDARVV